MAGRSIGQVSQPGIGAAAMAAEVDRTEAFHVHELQRSDDDLPRRIDVAECAGRGLGAARRAGRSGVRRGGAGLVSVEGRDANQHVPRPSQGSGEDRADADDSLGLRRFQHQRDAALRADAVSVARRRRPFRAAEPARRRRVRRRLARSRHARPEAEHVRRFHRGRGVAAANRYTDPAHLAIRGVRTKACSPPALTQRPELFRVALVEVPLRHATRISDGALLGADTAIRKCQPVRVPPRLLAISPRQGGNDTRRGSPGEHDSRVHALHARKMAARPQACTGSDPADRPELLWVDRDAGHGQG